MTDTTETTPPKGRARRTKGRFDTDGIVFDRLYVLRNQLIHGGATWNSQINRAQVADGIAILGTLVPLVLAIMMEHPQDYGDVLYPVVG